MDFAVEALLIEVRASNQRIIQLLQEEQKLLRDVLARLPKPQTYYATVGGSITVRN
jgi:hypothetical protein